MRGQLSRRELLTGSLHLVVVTSSARILTGCKGGDKTLTCTDISDLSSTERETRNAQKYSDKSPHSDKTCSNCNFNVPSPEANACASCKIIPGPVHPDGYCNGWAKIEPT